MRLRFQTKDVLFEVKSTIDYNRRGRMHYKTFYNGDNGETADEILRRARRNIEKKFKRSQGKIITLKIVAVYK